MSGGHLSKEFFELVKQIGESRSKQEEDKIISNEVLQLKHHLNQKTSISTRRMKEYLVRAIYVEMLGHDASLAYIHAVKLTNEKNLIAKRIGYLACNVFLHKDHEFMLLLINTLQRDLNSTNHLEVCAALIGISRLVNLEMVPAILPLVLKRLDHPKEVVRKKAIIALQRFYQLDPSTIADARDTIRKVLCDSDPSVMGASLHLLHDMAKDNPAGSKDLVPSFVSILKQVTEHRLSRDYDYHRIPAPWLQVKLLQILGTLGHADQKSSEQMYEIIGDCMRRADSGVNVGYAIVYECVKAIAKIYPNPPLIELAASNISRFISSENHNLRYLGVTGLVQIVQVNPSYAAEHQIVVVDCLEDPDETLKRKTLNLLYRMTNPSNCEIIAAKLLYHLKLSVDAHLRRELVQKITALAERFAPNNEWYITTMNEVFEMGGDLVPVQTAHNMIRLLSEGTGQDDQEDDELRRFAVNCYIKLLERPRLPDLLVQLVAWVLGEYAILVTVDGYTVDDVVDLLTEVLERSFEDPSTTRGFIVSALLKLAGRDNNFSSTVDAAIMKYRKAQNTDLQQRCTEFLELRKDSSLMHAVLPYDAHCEDFQVDEGLSFLNNYVQAATAAGMQTYLRPEDRRRADSNTNGVQPKGEVPANLNFTPYEVPSTAPRTNINNTSPGRQGSFPVGQPNAPGAQSKANAGASTTELRVSGPRKWGPDGYQDPRSNTTLPTQTAQPPPKATGNVTYSSTVGSPTSGAGPGGRTLANSSSNTGKTSNQFSPPLRKELTEKEKMAAALFSGVAENRGGMARPSMPKDADTAPSTKTTDPRTEPPVPQTAPPPGTQRAVAAANPPAAAAAAAAPPAEPANLLQQDAGTLAIPAPTVDLLDFSDEVVPTGAGSPPVDLHQTATTGAGSPPPVDLTTTNLDILSLDISTPASSLPPARAPILPSSPLIPLSISTQELGSLWGSLPVELTSRTLHTNFSSCRHLVDRMVSILNVKEVEIIGDEAITAGIAPQSQNSRCFLHGSLAPGGGVSMLLKCDDAQVAQQVIGIINQHLG